MKNEKFPFPTEIYFLCALGIKEAGMGESSIGFIGVHIGKPKRKLNKMCLGLLFEFNQQVLKSVLVIEKAYSIRNVSIITLTKR